MKLSHWLVAVTVLNLLFVGVVTYRTLRPDQQAMARQFAKLYKEATSQRMNVAKTTFQQMTGMTVSELNQLKRMFKAFPNEITRRFAMLYRQSASKRTGRIKATFAQMTGKTVLDFAAWMKKVDAFIRQQHLPPRRNNGTSSDKGLSSYLTKLRKYLKVTEGLLLVEGANLQIVNGLGRTSSRNQLGNLILGYNEARVDKKIVDGHEKSVKVPVPQGHRRGSHNLVIGTGNYYMSYGGIVAGTWNLIAAPFATVTGGASHRGYGYGSSISGGHGNTTGVFKEPFPSVKPFQYNALKPQPPGSGIWASISGGQENVAIGGSSSILGGRLNRTGVQLAQGCPNDNKHCYCGRREPKTNKVVPIDSQDDITCGQHRSGTLTNILPYCHRIHRRCIGITRWGIQSISGGQQNIAGGPYSSVPGGSGNQAYR